MGEKRRGMGIKNKNKGGAGGERSRAVASASFSVPDLTADSNRLTSLSLLPLRTANSSLGAAPAPTPAKLQLPSQLRQIDCNLVLRILILLVRQLPHSLRRRRRRRGTNDPKPIIRRPDVATPLDNFGPEFRAEEGSGGGQDRLLLFFRLFG
jgi:hypothetical protein